MGHLHGRDQAILQIGTIVRIRQRNEGGLKEKRLQDSCLYSLKSQQETLAVSTILLLLLALGSNCLNLVYCQPRYRCTSV